MEIFLALFRNFKGEYFYVFKNKFLGGFHKTGYKDNHLIAIKKEFLKRLHHVIFNFAKLQYLQNLNVGNTYDIVIVMFILFDQKLKKTVYIQSIYFS